MAPAAAASSSTSGNTTSVQVAVRIRPSTSHDLASIPTRQQRVVVHTPTNTTVAVDNVSSGPPATASPANAALAANKKTVFAFDQVHSPKTTQFELFTATAAPLISRFVEGFNCTILAYGQTSSGKTYSMTGVDLDADPTDPTNGMGIIPRAISTIFSRAAERKRELGNAWQWSIKCSYIEIYNEDLIDLLAVDDAGGARREVQIREEKDGTILWSGLREIPVRSAADVMAILSRGTANRRTNETEMNAQSSRSHAIFSVTLTQKKFSGSGTPPRGGRSSPLPPNGTPSPSKIARPGSMYGGSPSRVASPTFGRALPSSFGAAMSRGGPGGMLRPSSAMGFQRAEPPDEEERGEWTTVVSKFHFVDLAGSERLKRTAAVGERIKEGISINGGLLALGNVISALGDPSRAKTLGAGGAIHVPYRDSKLTRLLQDSLGGNAHTLMIACVSPQEWNHNETVNTLKYANRARNIRNRAEIREKEDGWDDLEWLQTMVTKLRKELKSLKEGGAVAGPTTVDTTSTEDEPTTSLSKQNSLDRSGGKVLKQYAELQAQYRNLRTEYVERNEELARMRRELEEKSSPTGGARRYEEIVGPVIEEYEKTIGAMEAELKLSRTALEHTNEMYNEQENELAVYKERTANADGYIEALRSRLAKLAERESSTESYIRDLEAKMKTYADAAIAEDSAAELRKEIAKYKESEGVSATYISTLEQRLTRADDDIVGLRSQVEKLEADLERRDIALAKLNARVEAMLRENEDMRQWKESLAEREKRVQDLERQMEEWEKVRSETGLQRQRLVSEVSEVETSRRSLEAEVNGVPAPSSPTHSTITITSANPTELGTLREKHQSTLAELESVSAKYRDALKEISDLAAQIAEAKLHSETSSEVSSDAPSTMVMLRSPKPGRRSLGRRDTADSASSLSASSSRRNFFRHAASSEGLHSRSQSQSLSSEFSSAPYSRTSWGANGDSLLSPTSGSFNPIVHSRRQMSVSEVRTPERLEKEIQSLQSVLKDREAEIDALEKRLAETSPGFFPAAPLSASTNGGLPNVKEEADLASPSDTLVEADLGPGITSQLNSLKNSLLVDERRQDAERREAESISRLDELMRSMALKESQHVSVVDGLNEELESLRRQHEDLATTSRDQAAHMSAQSQAMSGEIENLRADIAAAEKRHAAASLQLDQLRVREAELAEAVRAAKELHAKEMEDLRAAHSSELQNRDEEAASLVQRHASEVEALQASITDANATHDAAVVQLGKEHSEATARLSAEHADALSQLKAEHEAAITRVKDEGKSALESSNAEYDAVLAKFSADHELALRHQSEASDAALARLRDDHASELRQLERSREGTLTESQERQAAILEELRAEHQSTLERKEADFKSDLEKAQTELERVRADLKATHAAEVEKLQSLIGQRDSELAQVKSEHAQAISERETSHAAQVETLQTEHVAALSALASTKDEEITKLTATAEQVKSEHEANVAALNAKLEASLADLANTHSSEVDGVRAEHAIALNKLKSEHREALSEAQSSLSAAQDEHRQAISQLREDHQVQMDSLREEHKAAVAEIDASHDRERETLRKAHQLAEQEAAGLKSAVAQLESEAQRLTASHQEKTLSKDKTIAALEGELITIKDEQVLFADTIQELQGELERTRQAHEDFAHEASKRQSVISELEHHRSILGDTQNELQRTKDDMDTLREEKNRQDQLIAELRAQVAALNKPRTGLPPAKLPPLTPPPSIPPPPIPGSLPPVPSLPAADSSHSTATRSSLDSSEETHSSDRSTTSTSVLAHAQIDPKIQQQLLEQARHVEEQESMIKTLNKQLTHCESDLQAHMDLVATLETSLTDSERNLRKTRMQANEFSKERDRLTGEVEALRQQLQQSQQEIAEARRNVIEEKQNYETRLEEERRNKERTRTQLENRMDEISKRKSNFVCF